MEHEDMTRDELLTTLREVQQQSGTLKEQFERIKILEKQSLVAVNLIRGELKTCMTFKV